jgi:choline-sulfatase
MKRNGISWIAGAILGLAAESHASPRIQPSPNILVIVSDQLSAAAVGAYGNRAVHTPNIDRLAARGVRFSRAYTTYPLCTPSRAALWTGRLPHETGISSNPVTGTESISAQLPTLGSAFAAAGYEAVHFGKEHDAGSLRGFRREAVGQLPVRGTEAWPAGPETARDRHTTDQAVEFLSRRQARPFLAVVDLINPHEVCSWVGRNEGPHEDQPIPRPLPALPPNFELLDLELRPIPVRYLCCTHRRLAQAARWSESNYRHYLAAYHHYVSRVDGEVGRILDALDASPARNSTLVVLLADHGDGMAAHRQVTKQANFYEEAVRVPFIAATPGGPRGVAVEEALVSLLDLLPTLCEYARVPVPEGVRGRSLLPWLRGGGRGPHHRYVVSQWHTEYGEAVTPGRMLRTDRYKYVRYLEGDGEELFDLAEDPGEMRTLVRDPAYADALGQQRALFTRYLQETNDPFLSLQVAVDPRWRSHPVGYRHHPGPSALDEALTRARRPPGEP